MTVHCSDDISENGNNANPKLNTALRSAIDDALRQDIPNSTIQNFLKKQLDKSNTAKLGRYVFEVRVSNVYAVFTVFTDNLTLAKMQLNTVLRKARVIQTDTRHMFDERGTITVTAGSNVKPDDLEEHCMNDAIECGAEDVEIDDVESKQATFFCAPSDFDKVKQKLSAAGYNSVNAEIAFYPKQAITISEADREHYENFKERVKTVDGFDEIYDNISVEDDS